MVKQLLLTIMTLLVFLEPANAAHALEGLVKFPGKNNATVFLEVAATNEAKSKGLMNKSSMPSNRGMVFVFRPARTVTFWMKDTLISLDMIFINKGNIVKIVHDAVPNQTNILYPSENDVTEVIEVNGGFADAHSIKIGDFVVFENIADIDYSKKSDLMIVVK